MTNDYIKCKSVGTIASRPKMIIQQNKSKMISFKLNIATFREKVTIKMFDLDDAQVKELLDTFALGDKIEVVGEVRCDAFVNQNRLVRGLCVVPSAIKLLEKGSPESLSNLQIIK